MTTNAAAKAHRSSRLPVILLVLLALALALPGILGLLAPGLLAGSVGQTNLGIDALNEARAVGATRLGVALLLAFAAYSPSWRRAGSIAGLLVFGSTLAGRLLSNALDGAPGPMLKPEVAEAVLLALGIIAMRIGASRSAAVSSPVLPSASSRSSSDERSDGGVASSSI